jgi:hypothetical protein
LHIGGKCGGFLVSAFGAILAFFGVPRVFSKMSAYQMPRSIFLGQSRLIRLEVFPRGHDFIFGEIFARLVDMQESC